MALVVVSTGETYNTINPKLFTKPGKGKTHRAYLWSYCTTVFNPLKAVIFGFAPSRSGEHVRDFLARAPRPSSSP